MDITIKSDLLNGSTAAPASRAGETAPVAKHGQRHSGIGGGHGEDTIGLSSLASDISAANDEAQVKANERVAALAALYAQGKDGVDSKRLSHSLVAHAIGSSEGDLA